MPPDQEHIKQGMLELKSSISGMKTTVDKLVFCLVGDVDNSGGLGLIAEHRFYKSTVEKCSKDVEKIDERLRELEVSRRYIIAYITGGFAVICFAYYFLQNHVNLPKITINPSAHYEKSKQDLVNR